MFIIKSLRARIIMIILCSILIVGGVLFFYLNSGKEKSFMPVESGLQEFYSEKLEMGYYLYIPEGYNPKEKTKYPLIMHLHGSGAGGNGKDELLKVKYHGLKALLYDTGSRKCFVLAPQAKSHSQWRDRELDMLLDEITSTYAIDTDRVYLTGVSMGGVSTWSYALNGKRKLAAIVPICGSFYFSNEVANRLSDIPIWLFHRKKDTTIPVSRAYEIIEKLEGKNPDFKYTIYENGGHDIWNEVYSTSELYDWLLKQTRKK